VFAVAVDRIFENGQHEPPLALYRTTTAKRRKVLIRQQNVRFKKTRPGATL
jgi:hypothetical protein